MVKSTQIRCPRFVIQPRQVLVWLQPCASIRSLSGWFLWVGASVSQSICGNPNAHLAGNGCAKFPLTTFLMRWARFFSWHHMAPCNVTWYITRLVLMRYLCELHGHLQQDITRLVHMYSQGGGQAQDDADQCPQEELVKKLMLRCLTRSTTLAQSLAISCIRCS